MASRGRLGRRRQGGLLCLRAICSPTARPRPAPPYAAEIDTGSVSAILSAYLGGYADQNDSAKVQLFFIDSTQQTIGLTLLGPTAAARGSTTTLLPRADSALVPKGTHFLVVEVDFVISQGPYNDGYADNISLKLMSSASSPPSPAPPSSPSTSTPSSPSSPAPPSSSSPSPPSQSSPSHAPTTTSAAEPAKPALSLVCAGKTLVATLKPPNGTKVSSVWFYANGKVKAKDRRAPFVAAIPTKGLNLPLKVAVAIQASGTSTFLRKQFRGC